MTFKFIKSTPFKVETVDYINYVVGYKGRAININTLSFSDTPEIKIALSADKKTVTVEGKVAVMVKPYLDLTTNATVNGLSLMPKFDIELDTV